MSTIFLNIAGILFAGVCFPFFVSFGEKLVGRLDKSRDFQVIGVKNEIEESGLLFIRSDSFSFKIYVLEGEGNPVVPLIVSEELYSQFKELLLANPDTDIHISAIVDPEALTVKRVIDYRFRKNDNPMRYQSKIANNFPPSGEPVKPKPSPPRIIRY